MNRKLMMKYRFNNRCIIPPASAEGFNAIKEGQKIRDAMFRSGRGVSQVTDYCEATSPLL